MLSSWWTPLGCVAWSGQNISNCLFGILSNGWWVSAVIYILSKYSPRTWTYTGAHANGICLRAALTPLSNWKRAHPEEDNCKWEQDRCDVRVCDPASPSMNARFNIVIAHINYALRQKRGVCCAGNDDDDGPQWLQTAYCILWPFVVSPFRHTSTNSFRPAPLLPHFVFFVFFLICL